MRGFVSRMHIDEAHAQLRPRVRSTQVESVALGDALDRTLAADVVSDLDVPGFRKSAVDGYGLQGAASFGALPNNPLGFPLRGEVLPGTSNSALRVGRGEAVRIMTGGPIPAGVDAVVMAEYCDERDDQVFVREAVTPGRNVVPIGEDVRRGDRVLAAGRRLEPHDLGVLASLGRRTVAVRCRPVVAIASTGNELVTPQELATAGPTAVVNSNGYMLEALVRRHGGEPHRLDIVRDEYGAIDGLLREFPGDLLVTTGGTSVGKEDFLPVALASVGQVHVHGINVRPGSPTGFGQVGERLVFLLPGNPVAAWVGFEVLVRPCLEWMLGRSPTPRGRLRGRLTRKVASALNRVDYVRVRVDGDAVEPVRSGGAGVLTSLSQANGYLVIDKDLEGWEAGSEVDVWPL